MSHTDCWIGSRNRTLHWLRHHKIRVKSTLLASANDVTFQPTVVDWYNSTQLKIGKWRHVLTRNVVNDEIGCHVPCMHVYTAVLTPIFQYGCPATPKNSGLPATVPVRVSVESSGIQSTCTGVCNAYEHTRVDVVMYNIYSSLNYNNIILSTRVLYYVCCVRASS
jgi:hypothetical protein